MIGIDSLAVAELFYAVLRSVSVTELCTLAFQPKVDRVFDSHCSPKSPVEFMGQIHRSNYWSNCSVESVGQIHRSNSRVKSAGQMLLRNRWSNSRVKLLVELLGQILRSNSWIKFLGQIAGSNCWGKLLGDVTPNVTPVTRDVTQMHASKRSQFAARRWPA